MKREFKYSLYFACVCLMIAVMLDMTGQFLLLRYFPGLSLDVAIYIWYSSIIWASFLLTLYVGELFQSFFATAAVRGQLIATVFLQLFFTFTPATFYTRVGGVVDFMVGIGVLCTMVMVTLSVKQNQREGWLHILSITVVATAYVHDMLFLANRIRSDFGEISAIGLFLFLFLQMIIQAKRIRQYHDQEVAAELRFLQAQIKPHFLYNALNTFVSISRFDADKARSLLINFSNYLRRSFDFRDLSDVVPLKNEIELIRAYVEIEKARFEEQLDVRLDICDDIEIKVPILMIQPVIENAINHGVLPKEGTGRVDVSVKREGGFMVFSVKDDGVGMEAELREGIKKGGPKSGVGLSNIDSRLRKLYGKGLRIESAAGAGTEVTWRIPIK